MTGGGRVGQQFFEVAVTAVGFRAASGQARQGLTKDIWLRCRIECPLGGDMIRAHLIFAASAIALGGCTTTSFAPRPVAIRYTGDTPIDFKCATRREDGASAEVPRTLRGSYQLIDTFIAAVRCDAHSAANGRQAFEIPAFLSTTGAAAAVALGGGATYGVVGTAANSVFNAGNSYWNPKQKASFYDHALDGLLCIKTEAVGIEAIKNPTSTAQQMGMTPLAEGFGRAGSISVSVEEQYFMMVSAAVFTVERVLAQRLSSMAPVDAASVVAAIKQAAAERDKAEEAKKKPPPGSTPVADALNAEARVALTRDDRIGLTILADMVRTQEMAPLDLAVLKPKLDDCVARAKL